MNTYITDIDELSELTNDNPVQVMNTAKLRLSNNFYKIATSGLFFNYLSTLNISPSSHTIPFHPNIPIPDYFLSKFDQLIYINSTNQTLFNCTLNDNNSYYNTNNVNNTYNNCWLSLCNQSLGSLLDILNAMFSEELRLLGPRENVTLVNLQKVILSTGIYIYIIIF